MCRIEHSGWLRLPAMRARHGRVSRRSARVEERVVPAGYPACQCTLATPEAVQVLYVRKGLNLPMQLSSAAGVVSRLRRLVFETHQPVQFLDITDAVSELVRVAGLREGVANIFSRHTTAA